MIQSVRRALSLMECVASHHERPVRLGEIAQEVGLNEATCAHLLATLVEADYLEQVAPRKGYVLGPMIHHLARSSPYRERLVRIAEPLLRRFAATTGETALVAGLHNRHRFILTFSEGNQDIQISPDLFFREDLLCPTGRQLLAHLPESELESLLAEQKLPNSEWPEVSSLEEVRRELARIREEEMILVSRPEVTSFALPLYEGPKVVAALGAFLPTARFTGRHRRQVPTELRRTARSISEHLSRPTVT